MSDEQRKPKTMTGSVISNKMDKTIAVKVQRTVKHSLYEKYLTRSTRVLAHDENNECSEGDIVTIEPSRPVSKNKSWKLQKIVTRAQKL